MSAAALVVVLSVFNAPAAYRPSEPLPASPTSTDPYAGFRHPGGWVHYKDGQPFGGTVYLDSRGTAWEQPPSQGEILWNRLGLPTWR